LTVEIVQTISKDNHEDLNSLPTLNSEITEHPFRYPCGEQEDGPNNAVISHTPENTEHPFRYPCGEQEDSPNDAAISYTPENAEISVTIDKSFDVKESEKLPSVVACNDELSVTGEESLDTKNSRKGSLFTWFDTFFPKTYKVLS